MRKAVLAALVVTFVLAVPASATHESIPYDPPPESGTVSYDGPPACTDPAPETVTLANGAVVTVDLAEICHDPAPVDVPYTHDPPPRDVPIPHPPPPSPQPPEPPPPPPPPPPAGCTIQNVRANGPEVCRGQGGTQITVTAHGQFPVGAWRCDRLLSNYGPLPIEVTVDIPNNQSSGQTGVLIGHPTVGACVGDGDPNTIDLIVWVVGNGGSRGPSEDAVKIGDSARDIEFTGDIECGLQTPIAHQDGVQFQGNADRITAYGLTSGNPAVSSAWTCDGSGGGWFVSNTNVDAAVCDNCEIAAQNSALRSLSGTNSGARDSVFGTTGGINPCVVTSPGGVNERNVCNQFP